MEEIKEKIINVMATVFGVDKDQLIDNAGPGLIESWDSLRHMNLILVLEEEFEIAFTDEEMTELISLDQILSIVSSKIK